MKLLAVDPSISTLGWALFDDSELVEYGTIRTRPNENMLERLRKITSELKQKMEGIDCVAIEMPPPMSYDRSKGRNYQSLQKLNITVGAVLCLALLCDKKILSVSVTAWKKNKPKATTAAEAALLFYLKKKPNKDEADAIGVGNYALETLRYLDKDEEYFEIK